MEHSTNHHVHAGGDNASGVEPRPVSLNRLALSATTHCLTGRAIGEVLGMVIGTARAWTNAATIALSVALAFVFGYALNRWLIARGRGHAVIHRYHGHH